MPAQRLRSLPGRYNDLVRKSLRTVLLLEADAIRRLRIAMTEATIEARATLLTLDEEDDETEAYAAIRDASWKLYLAIVALLLLLRRGSRDASSAQFEAEARLAGIDLAALLLTFQPSTEEDTARSESVARSFSAAWMLAALAIWRRRQKDTIGAVNTAVDYRLRRIAGTEIPHAFGRAHDERMRELADVLGDNAALWAKRWDATLDLKTCKTCEAMHGEIAPLGAAFSSGLLPGDVHPYCRCVPSLIPIPAVLEKAA